jgi:hypothetical protein
MEVVEEIRREQEEDLEDRFHKDLEFLQNLSNAAYLHRLYPFLWLLLRISLRRSGKESISRGTMFSQLFKIFEILEGTKIYHLHPVSLENLFLIEMGHLLSQISELFDFP